MIQIYRCNRCNEKFDTPKPDREYFEYWGASCTRIIYVCPKCESGDIEEIWEREDEGSDFDIAEDE